MADEGVDWTGVTEKMARQILAQGELFLQNQQQLAIAADQRATTSASVLGSAGTAIAAAFIALWNTSTDKAPLIGGFVAGGLLIVAAALAAVAARPTTFESAGNEPQSWFKWRKGNLVSMIGGEAESVQRRIDRNDKLMGRNQEWLRWAFRVALSAPMAGVASWRIIESLCA